MLSIHSPFPQNPPFSIPNPSVIAPPNKHTSLPISQFLHHDGAKGRTIFSSSFNVLRAMEKDSEFTVDPEKAREALQKLDQELQTLSNKKVGTPKIKATEVNFTMAEIMGEGEGEDVPEVSGSFLTSLTIGLFIFTIIYNIFFYAVLKPAVDGPDDVRPIVKTESEAILE